MYSVSTLLCSHLLCYLDGPLDVLALGGFVDELVVNPPVPLANSIFGASFYMHGMYANLDAAVTALEETRMGKHRLQGAV